MKSRKQDTQCDHVWRLRQIVNTDPTPGDVFPNLLYVHCPECGDVRLIGTGAIISGADNE